jgi:hypothetical protein
MSEQEISELAQLKEQYPIVSANDYARMDEQERVRYFHFLDLLEKEIHLNAPEDEGYPE